MKTRHIFFSNVPTGMNETEFESELLRNFKVFRDARSRGTKIHVEIFLNLKDPENVKTTAVVSGVLVDIDRLHCEAVGKKCRDRNWVFKRDFGDARDDDGDFITKLPPPKRRMYDYLTGISVRFIRPAFNVDFLQLLNNTFSSTRSVYIDQQLDYEHLTRLFDSCALENSISIYSRNMTRCFFVSALDALQAIALSNGTSSGANGVFHFVDEDNKHQAQVFWQHGIGKDGALLNIIDYKLSTGYVPFENLSTLIFNIDALREIPSYCWKCESPFYLLGIDVNLKFVAARCNCSYDASLDVNSEKRAFFWDNEKFTRLAAGKTENGQIGNWIISHQTMNDFYSSVKEYRSIIFPILTEEWKYSTQDYKVNHTAQGRFMETHRIQTIRDGTSTHSLFGAIIRVPRTEFWSQPNFKEIGEITLDFLAKEGRQERLEERNARLLQLVDNISLNVTYLFVQFKLNQFQRPSNECLDVVVVPKPIKITFQMVHRMLNKWRNKPYKYPHFNIILSKLLDFEPAPGAPSVVLNTDDNQIRHVMCNILDTLNSEQMAAVSIGTANKFSLVIGPPGTGKTYTSAVICTFRRLQENKVVLAVAPSNYAVDGLASSISRLLETHNIRLKVLRVYARRQGDEFTRSHSTPDLGARVRCLHEKVASHPRYLNIPSLERARQLIQTNQLFRITEEERDALEKHLCELEWEIMNQADVILCTIGVLSDGRIRNWNKEHKVIGALLLDEAGMVLQPHLLTVLDMHQTSTTLIGDPNQLSPVVSSFSAELTGFALSALEWFQISGIPIPTVTLLEQHRMAPPIRRLVSMLSYDGKLRDHFTVKQVPENLLKAFENAVKTTKNIVLYRHNFLEERQGTMIRNKKEALLIVELVTNLRQSGISAEDITILTLYDWQRRYLLQKGVEARTVDSFQGRENKIVILSMTRGGGEIGFSSRLNRLNVALSRAKHFLIIAMNWETFTRHQGQAIQKFIGFLLNHKNEKDVEFRKVN